MRGRDLREHAGLLRDQLDRGVRQPRPVPLRARLHPRREAGPVLVPGAAVSPGTRICSFEKPAALTGIAVLVLLAIATCVVSETVTVQLPPVFRVTLKALVPPASAALAGKTAFTSLEVIATVSFVLIKFQFAFTNLTMTLNAVPSA